MEKTYRILLDENRVGMKTGVGHITEEGAILIYKAYIELYGTSQSMDQREKRGGICWLSEIKGWIEKGLLPKDFDWRKYEVDENS